MIARRARIFAGIAAIFVACASSGNAQVVSDSQFSTLHRLTVAELERVVFSPASQRQALRARLAIARRMLASNISAAAELIAKLDGDILYSKNPNEWIYLRSLEAELSVRTGDLDTARQALLRARQRDSGITDASARVALLLGEGLLLVRTSRQSEAIPMYRRARHIAEAAGDMHFATMARHNEAVSQTQLGMVRSALENLSAVNSNLEHFPSDDANIYGVKFNLAYIERLSGEYESALAKFYEVRPIWLENGHLTRSFIVTTQIARALHQLGRHQEAVAEISGWLGRDDVDAGPDLTIDAELILAQSSLALAEFDQAEQALTRAKALAAQIAGTAKHTEIELLEISLLRARGQLEAAERDIRATVERLAVPDEPTVGYLDALVLQAEIFSEMGRFDAAYDTQQAVLRIEHELRTAEYDDNMSSARIANELESQQRELDILKERERTTEARIERDQMFQTALIGVGVLLMVVAYLVWSKWHAQRVANDALQDTVAERTEQVREEMQRRIEAERNQRRLESKLVEDDKYRAVARLTGGLAHDFNNLMTVVSCSAELVKLKTLDNDLAMLADDILEAADSGTRVTRSLIAYARQQALNPEVTRLDEFIVNNEALFRNTLGEQIELKINVAPCLVTIDKASMTTALLNVLFNARDAISNHGHVEITLVSDNSVSVRGGCRLSIRDDGVGMDADTLNRAMEPFFTTRKGNKTSGMGLGLSTVYGFMRQSNGNVEVESAPNDGTTVHLLLPAADDVQDRAKLRPRALRPLPSAGEAPTVLLVEDQDKIRLLTRQALEASGYRVWDCSSGSEAIELLNGRQTFDIVVSDIVMPGSFSGIDVVRTAQQVRSDTRILLTSGHADVVPREFEFLPKPYSVAALLIRVEELIDSSRETSRTPAERA